MFQQRQGVLVRCGRVQVELDDPGRLAFSPTVVGDSPGRECETFSDFGSKGFLHEPVARSGAVGAVFSRQLWGIPREVVVKTEFRSVNCLTNALRYDDLCVAFPTLSPTRVGCGGTEDVGGESTDQRSDLFDNS